MNINEYLEGKEVKKINIGQSKADVYEIDNDVILKHVRRDATDDDLFKTYSKEALFYKSRMECSSYYIPKVMKVELSDDEITVLMRKYLPLERSELNEELIRKITQVLARIHTDEIPEFLSESVKETEPLSSERIDYCLKGWKSVLNEHPGAFEENGIDPIASKINDIKDWHDTEARVLIHGDFHFDNLLKDKDGNIVVCDWQGVSVGGASEDLSFFMSRLGADSTAFNPELVLSLYADAIKEITGETVNILDIKKHMAAANVITSFEFWHEFLHGNDEERVRGIYDKMVEDFQKVSD